MTETATNFMTHSRVKIPQRFNSLLFPPRKPFSIRVSLSYLGLSTNSTESEIQISLQNYLKNSGISVSERASVGEIEIDSANGSVIFQVIRDYSMPNPFYYEDNKISNLEQ